MNNVDQSCDLLNDFSSYLVNLKSVEAISKEDCSRFVNGITSKRIHLVQLIEKLGPFLIDTDHDKREQGCQVLATVLALLPYDALSLTEVDFIARFLCERMKDHHTVVPAALKGTLAIARMKNVSDGIAAEFFSTAFIHFYCQSQRQEDRSTFYQIICQFMGSKTTELLKMGTDFVYGVISSMDGEKDPRNLMLLFTKLVPKFISIFKLEHLTEETFEVLGCYFPVDFQPLTDDPAAITRIDLASALQPCLVATPEFADFTIPLALEKLVSSLPIAKLDSLKLLVESCSKFPATVLIPHITTIWHTLRSEILTCVSDGELRELCFKVLYCLVQNLSHSALDSQQSSVYTGLLRDIVATMRGYLSDLSLSLFNPICKLLENVASASNSACSFIMTKVVPILVNLTPKSSPESVTLLKALSAFLQVCFNTQVLPEDKAQLEGNYEKIVSLYLSALSSGNTEEIEEGAKGFIIVLPLLSKEERVKFFDVVGSLLKKDLNNPLRVQLLKSLKAAAIKFPDDMLDQITKGQLQLNHGMEAVVQERCLMVLCYLSDQEHFFPHLCAHIQSITELNSRENIALFLSSFKNLIEIENVAVLNGAVVVNSLLTGLLQMDCADDNFFRILEDAFQVINSITLNLDERDESSLVTYFLPKIIDRIQRGASDSELLKIKNLFLLSSPLTRSRVQIDDTSSFQILQFCLDLIFLCTKKDITFHAARFIALLVNKSSDFDATVKIEKIQNFFHEKINSGENTIDSNCQIVCLTGWIVKALITRNHPSADFWINSLVNLLGDPDDTVRIEAAQMFQVIVEDDPYFSIASHCNIKLLYRQRLFQYVPKLVELSKLAESKTSYLMAVLYQLNHIPSQVIIMYLSQVLPVLIETVKSESLEHLQLPALKIISSLLQAKSQVLQPHLGTFISSLLSLAKSSPQMKIRMAALQCLYNCSLFEESVILPQKSIVLQDLIPCLDDKKRLVRREAVRTRSRWFLVGAPVR